MGLFLLEVFGSGKKTKECSFDISDRVFKWYLSTVPTLQLLNVHVYRSIKTDIKYKTNGK